MARRSIALVRLQEGGIARKYNKCSLHDMMRDLCIAKVREEEFIQAVDFQPDSLPLLKPSLPPNFACRLVVRMDDEVVNGVAKASTRAQLRSLLCLSKMKEKEIIWPQERVNLENTKSLRALNFEGYDFQKKKLPVEIRKMIHLRYLNVNNCRLDELPSSISELPFLQTLPIRVNNNIKIPNVLCKMKHLRHLYIYGAGHHTENGKLRLHGLTELETLCSLDSTTDEVSDVANLLNLRVLVARVCDKINLHVLIDHIYKNELKLKETTLCIDGFDLVGSEEGSVLLRKFFMCGNLHHLVIVVEMSKFPKYEPQMLQNLVDLYLEKNKIEDDPMKVLEMLPHLHTLTLGPDAYMGKDMTCHAWGFPKLRVLHLFQLSNLEYWWICKGAMPKMSSLMIWECQKLEMIPDGLQFVTSLEDLTIYAMPGKFCDRIKDLDDRKGDDYYKIQHVPSIFMDRPLEFVIEAACRRRQLILTINYIVYRSMIRHPSFV